jgi:hypothetical protein
MNDYDVAVAYRVSPHLSQSTVGFPFSGDKLKLSEICLRSFRESLGNLRVKVWVLLDGCSADYASIFKRYFCEQELILIDLNGVGNQETFSKQVELLCQQEDSDIVYLAEDDYLYLPGEFSSMIDFLRQNSDVDFVSPYDHLDCYTLRLHQEPKWLKVCAGRHWRTAASTCLTFLTRREILRNTRTAFRNYRRRSFDCSVWLSLTKHRIFNPLFFIEQVFREPLFCKIIVKSWLYCWRQILFGKSRRLWISLPAIATHLDVRTLAPNVDWRALMQSLEARISATAGVSMAAAISLEKSDDGSAGFSI